MTEGNETDGGNAIENSSTTITTPIRCDQLFGPFSNPLQWLSLRSSGSSCDNNCSPSHDLFASVDIARHNEEQNIEVIYKSGHFYFKAMKNIEVVTNGETSSLSNEMPKLYAWFSEPLRANLPSASMSILNGSTRYYCPLCNEVFMYANPVVLHMLCSCPKRIQIETLPLPYQQNKSPPHQPSLPIPSQATKTSSVKKKRSFDIASLVNEESNESSYNNNDNNNHNMNTNSSGNMISNKKRNRNGIESDGESVAMHYQNASIIGSSAFHRPKSPLSSRKSNSLSAALSTSLSSATVGCNSMTTSAFKKVDQKVNSIVNPYDFSSFYNRVAASAMMPSVTNSVMMPSMPMPTSMSASLSTSLSSSLSTSLSSLSSSAHSKSLVSNTLLPYLPPSLAALTFPTSNWCAKCNATFRMTSDLVYHMRSHHKNVTNVDPMKKKREEKLKCNICHETFRERHHLTRHMTSHQ